MNLLLIFFAFKRFKKVCGWSSYDFISSKYKWEKNLHPSEIHDAIYTRTRIFLCSAKHTKIWLGYQYSSIWKDLTKNVVDQFPISSVRVTDEKRISIRPRFTQFRQKNSNIFLYCLLNKIRIRYQYCSRLDDSKMYVVDHFPIRFIRDIVEQRIGIRLKFTQFRHINA